MTVVYVAGPYRGATPWEIEQHVRKAEELAYRVARLGAMPLCPHANTRFFHGTLSDEFWLEGTIELMSRCDAVILTDDWHLSANTRGEVTRAHQLNLPVFDHVESLRVWLMKGEGKN
jgi:hypothetical protein